MTENIKTETASPETASSKTAPSKIEKKGAKKASTKKAVPETTKPVSTDYAVIRSGGKQYRVAPGQRVSVEKLEGDVGQTITFSDVLLAKSGQGEPNVGAPLISGFTVTGKIVAQDRDKKVVIYKKRRRKGYTKKQGHRQSRTRVVIETIG